MAGNFPSPVRITGLAEDTQRVIAVGSRSEKCVGKWAAAGFILRFYLMKQVFKLHDACKLRVTLTRHSRPH
jgi:hypothetical protein